MSTSFDTTASKRRDLSSSVVNLFQVEEVADGSPSGVVAQVGVLDHRNVLAPPDKAAVAGRPSGQAMFVRRGEGNL
ncbi:hypothetical protein COUCH_26430 [Couchioplanes caeruleus]|uniref:hypothetical protein n=1 Tax=Couchioplanes caeruleus TaxID=56438 RepID=UPI0020BFDAD5|nr:hypothetical protein [Couchioplanes caeruleus]UQU62554.1 hypothetical protein COUCH_26430 [Couchioplanes caeruleus]